MWAPDSNDILWQCNMDDFILVRTMLLGLSWVALHEECQIVVYRIESRRKQRYWGWARKSRMYSFRSKGIGKIWWFRWSSNPWVRFLCGTMMCRMVVFLGRFRFRIISSIYIIMTSSIYSLWVDVHHLLVLMYFSRMLVELFFDIEL